MLLQRDRVFADANVLFSASYIPDHVFLFFWASSRTRMVTSQFAANETLRNVSSRAHVERLEHLLARTEVIASEEHRAHSEILLPGKDRPILRGALGCRSRFLVTGDKRHFGAYFDRSFETYYGVLTIIEPAALLRLLKSDSIEPELTIQ
jgi:hypothetical protein